VSGARVYNYHRNYDPTIGRYTQSDPVGFRGGYNTYAYANNSALDVTDMFGLAGGPYHPPDGVSTRCTWVDSCPELEGKMFILRRMINSHQGWDWNNPPPRGGNRHAQEIADLWRAYARCFSIYFAKCTGNCPFSGPSPSPSPAPAPSPAPSPSPGPNAASGGLGPATPGMPPVFPDTGPMPPMEGPMVPDFPGIFEPVVL
jgi:uncharacterized protein RhaS with RHS repeats